MAALLFLFHIEEDNGAIVLYCRAPDGASHVITVSDFKHYFYARNVPCLTVAALNANVSQRKKRYKRSNTDDDDDVRPPQNFVDAIDPILAEPIYHMKPHYQREEGRYVRVMLAHPSYQRDVVDALKDFGIACYEEKKITIVFRFLLNTGLSVGNWFTHDVTLGWKGIKLVPGDDSVPPLVSLVYDIECAAADGSFPKAERDPVVCIGCILHKTGGEPREFLFIWRETLPIVGCTTIVSKDEEEMFEQFRQFVLKEDPDWMVTFNGNGFDNPYLLNRAESKKWFKFRYLGRLSTRPAELKKDHFESKAHGGRDQIICTIPGRISLDVCEMIRREYKQVRTFTLNACGSYFLKQTKDDLHHSLITKSWNASPLQRQRLGKYCVRDSKLTFQLMQYLKLDLATLSISRVSVVDMHTVLTAGQQLKSTVLFARWAREYGFICPFAHDDNKSFEEYGGGLVLEVDPCFIKDIVVVFDFNSLYPSVIIRYNLCLTTLIAPDDVAKFKEEDYIRTPTGDCFVKKHVREGLLPMMLRELLAARGVAKKQMAAATDPAVKAVYDKLQDALKKEGNSKYGYMGAGATGHLPCVPVARSTTALGQEATKSVIAWFQKNEPHNPVVYGDTDSVFVRCPGMTVEQAFAYMTLMADRINAEMFIAPMRLAPEKCFDGLLFEQKKHYIGLKYEGSPTKKPLMFYKGVEVVRRDWCPLVSRIMKKVCKSIFIRRDVAGAVAYARTGIADLYAGRIELQELLLSAGLSKSVENYNSQMRHTTVVQKMQSRDMATAPRVGDRVCYIMVTGSDSKKVSEWSEDPIYVLENDIPINVKYYIERQLQEPLTRLLTPIIGDAGVHELFHGAHTLVRRIPTQRPTEKVSLLNFVIRKSHPCWICKAQTSSETVCPDCANDKTKMEAFRIKQGQELAEIENLVDEIHAVCHSCQQTSADTPIECHARDCPNLYTRFGRDKRLVEARKKII